MWKDHEIRSPDYEKTIDKIKRIHESEVFGCFVETGCLALTPKLMEVAGASKTVFTAQVPYNKEFEHMKYPEAAGERAVSQELTKAIVNAWMPREKTIGANPNAQLAKTEINNDNYWHYANEDASRINFVYASTWQIGDETNKVSTHGWVGIWSKLNKKECRTYYHISIHEKMTRKGYIDTIAKIGVDIIVSLLDGETLPADCYVDRVTDDDLGEIRSEIFEMMTKSTRENFLTFDNGKMVRLEDLFRDKEDIVIFKGSFNPPHIAHLEAAKMAEEHFRTKPVMMIAMEIYQKGWVAPSDMVSRVKMLNDLGYSVIVTLNGYFNRNVEYIRQKFKQPIAFVVGVDTVNRIIDSSYKILGKKNEIDTYFDNIGKGDQKFLDLYSNVHNEITKFEKDFENVKFFVIDRPGFERAKELTTWLKDYCIWKFMEHPISSTKIRELHEAGKHEDIKTLVPDEVYQNLLNLHKGKKK